MFVLVCDLVGIRLEIHLMPWDFEFRVQDFGFYVCWLGVWSTLVVLHGWSCAYKSLLAVCDMMRLLWVEEESRHWWAMTMRCLDLSLTDEKMRRCLISCKILNVSKLICPRDRADLALLLRLTLFQLGHGDFANSCLLVFLSQRWPYLPLNQQFRRLFL